MKRIGMHMSFDSVDNVVDTLQYYNLNTLQIATRNMRNMKQRASIEFELQELSKVLLSIGARPIVVHAPYALNPASPDGELRERCRHILQTDLDMMPPFPVRYVLHPGSYMGGDPMDGMKRLADVLHQLRIPRHILVCVETMAGQGTQLMYTQQQYEFLRDQHIQNVFMTFDTCHVFASGLYCTEMFDAYKDFIKVIHLNGSEKPFRSFVDRHAKAANNLLTEHIVEVAPDEVPIILETPSATMEEDIAWLHKIINK